MSDTDTNTSPTWKSRLRCEMGQTLAEYGLLLAFVSITAFGLTPLGQWLAARFTNLAVAI